LTIQRKAKQARDVAYWSEVAFLSFTESLLKLMGDDVSQAELARRVGVSRGYISRVFRGVENLTLETITKLAVAVGGSVRLHVAPQEHLTRWTDVPAVNDDAVEESTTRAGDARGPAAPEECLLTPASAKRGGINESAQRFGI
jgi:transcriptional regulator with XRE-family HTH domain